LQYDEILKHLAPCGLDCGRCAGYAAGEIRALSTRLKELLANYGRVAAYMAESRPEFAGYGAFEALLDTFSKGPCGGCRSGENICPLDSCAARTCHRETGVDFCFQCAQYPCAGQFAGMPLRERWMALNDRMKEVGVEAFYEEQLKTPRYPATVR